MTWSIYQKKEKQSDRMVANFWAEIGLPNRSQNKHYWQSARGGQRYLACADQTLLICVKSLRGTEYRARSEIS